MEPPEILPESSGLQTCCKSVNCFSMPGLKKQQPPKKHSILGVRFKNKKQMQMALAVGVGLIVVAFALLLSKDFSEYVGAVSGHWVSVMSGFVSIAITFYEKARRAVGKYLFYAIAALCIFYAGFQTWQDEHRLVFANAPHLTISASQIFGVQFAPKIMELVVLMHIQNSGAPSTVDQPTVKIIHSDGSKTDTLWVIRPTIPVRIHQPDGTTFILEPSEYLTSKAGERPIPTNGAVEGYFIVKVVGVEGADLMSSKAQISIRDSLGHSYSTAVPMSDKVDSFSTPMQQGNQ